MGINRISLPTAYMIETLRSNGISDEQILHQIKERDVTPWDRLHSNFDFTNLVELADQDGINFESIIQDGYTVKFITIRGLQTLLQLKFDKIVDRDYQVTETGISGLQLEESDFTVLKQLLSRNCKIQETLPVNKGIAIELV